MIAGLVLRMLALPMPTASVLGALLLPGDGQYSLFYTLSEVEEELRAGTEEVEDWDQLVERKRAGIKRQDGKIRKFIDDGSKRSDAKIGKLLDVILLPFEIWRRQRWFLKSSCRS